MSDINYARKPIARALLEILNEATRAARIHPPYHSAHEGLSVITEEFIEVQTEVFKRERDIEAMRTEVVQLGATALRFLLDVCDKAVQ